MTNNLMKPMVTFYISMDSNREISLKKILQ